jgi:hypothetical protein
MTIACRVAWVFILLAAFRFGGSLVWHMMH